MAGEIFGTLALLLLLAFMCETLVEALFGRIVDHIPAIQTYKWALIYVAVAAGIIGAFVYQFDLIYLASRFVESPVEKTTFGVVITGIAIGMGAGYIHQIISTYFPSKASQIDEHNIPSYG